MKARLSILAVACVVLFSAAPAQAQTNGCDVTPVTTVSNPYKVTTCSTLLDQDLNPVPVAQIQYRISIDGVDQTLRPLPSPVGAVNAAGKFYFELASQTSAKGAHSVTVAFVTADGEAVSAPFAFAVRGKPIKDVTAGVKQ